LFFAAFLKLIIPIKKTRFKFSYFLDQIALVWIHINSLIFKITQEIKLEVNGLENLSPKKSYLVISNHRSWTDIFVLQHIFKRKIPSLKFFLKRELIWVPVLGLAWWALDFPFLKRYSRQFLKKHPELKGKDMETTRKSCEKFKSFPVSVMNFVEGTRFDFAKHQKQKPPYKHLLLPNAGGIALVLSNMGNFLTNIIDVTIVYPYNQPPVLFWDLLAGRIPKIIVEIKILSVPAQVVGYNYQEDHEYKKRIQQWINQLWQEKDNKIEKIMIEMTDKSHYLKKTKK